MTCAELDRWVDEGMAEGLAAEARAHAASCARCSDVLAVALEIDALLASEPMTTAPPGFTDRVMSRVAEISRVAPAVRHAMPWWIEAAAQPASVLAATVAALMVWQLDALNAGARSVFRFLGAHLPQGPDLAQIIAAIQLPAAAVSPSLHQTEVLAGITLVAMPAAVWCAVLLYRCSERLTAASR